MAKGNMAACLAITLVHEGGYANHPKDPGGVTLQGVIQRTYDNYRKSKGKPTRPLTAAMLNDPEWRMECDAIYRERYWRPLACDALPAGVDLTNFDFGVNSGIGRAPKYLQATLGVPQTGRMDAVTIDAARRADGQATIQGMNKRRLAFLSGLGIWNTFKRGWSARVADVEAKSLAMWLRVTVGSPAPVAKRLADEGDAADKTANRQGVAAGTVGSGSVLGGDQAAQADVNWLLIGVCGVFAFLLVLGLVAMYRHNKARAAAFKAEAKNV